MRASCRRRCWGSTGLRPERGGEGQESVLSLVTELRTEGSELAKHTVRRRAGSGAAPAGRRMMGLGGGRPADNSSDGGA